MSVALAYAICAVVWGTTWFAIRVCIGPGGYPTLPAAALRFSLASLLLVGLWMVGFARPGPRSRRQLLWIGTAGLLNGFAYGLIYVGEESISGGLTAVLFATLPLFTALAAVATRTERVGGADLGGAALALVGIAVIFLDRNAVSAAQGTGVVLVLLAVVASAGSAVLFKREAGDVSPLAATGVFLAVTAASLWVAALARGGGPLPWPPPLRPTAALLYLAVVGSVIVFTAYLYLLKRVTLMTTQTQVFLQPLIALFVDALWEEQVQLVPRTYAGVAITLGGVMIALLVRTRRVAARAPA